MQVHKLEVMIIDHDGVGAEEIKTILENQRYPNHCIAPYIMKIDSAEIGEWDDDNPLNNRKTMQGEYKRLFHVA
jgi:hypothetical protein